MLPGVFHVFRDSPARDAVYTSGPQDFGGQMIQPHSPIYLAFTLNSLRRPNLTSDLFKGWVCGRSARWNSGIARVSAVVRFSICICSFSLRQNVYRHPISGFTHVPPLHGFLV